MPRNKVLSTEAMNGALALVDAMDVAATCAGACARSDVATSASATVNVRCVIAGNRDMLG